MGIGIWHFAGHKYGTEYFTGWLVEKALSVDNLFVFVIILSKFVVPPKYWQKILLFGILFALAARTVFILVGAAMLEYFSFTFLFFGALLIWTAVQPARHRDEDPDVEDSKITLFVQRKLPFSQQWNNGKMTVVENGRRLFTPMLLVMITIASTDLLFALDSIPAVYGITNEPYIVFAANAFALLGLRALFFPAARAFGQAGVPVDRAGDHPRLHRREAILHWAHGVWSWMPEIGTLLSLAVIVVILAITAVASLMKVRRDRM